MTKKINIGILAHVDAGKTTLSESILYHTGVISKLGRVDKKDAYLDLSDLEKARGITIFSNQARFNINDLQVTLLDTPGHVDFSAEMERTLQVIDYAILLINGADGVQVHSKTVWNLLKTYNIPAFIFVNKMDQKGTNKLMLLNQLQKELDFRCIDFSDINKENFYEELAMTSEDIMEAYIDKGTIDKEQIIDGIKKRNIFPTYFGSALKLDGVNKLIKGIYDYIRLPKYGAEFSAKVFKITRDDENNKLTHIKLTGGSLRVRDLIAYDMYEEKVTQIRMYSANKYEVVDEVYAGSICALIGLNNSYVGASLGAENLSQAAILKPVLSYKISPLEEIDKRELFLLLSNLEEELPELNIIWNEKHKEIEINVMGEIQIEIIQSIIKERFNIDVEFDSGSILYKETIENKVEGVGHFEPLKHYAEVHLLLEPLARGQGLVFETICSEDLLGKSWQNLVLSHLKEKTHIGVLTGSPITDMKITLVSGRAHNKHTEGGDFRQATYRAVRQGLKEASSLLLEPSYDFKLIIPKSLVGRAMVDIEQMKGSVLLSNVGDELATLTGNAPVIKMRNYQQEVNAYTAGKGKLHLSVSGYTVCHNQEEVVKQIGYDSESDIENPASSVFCVKGAGFLVSWDRVKDYMHLESYLSQDKEEVNFKTQGGRINKDFIDDEEIDNIINKTFYANSGSKSNYKKTRRKKIDYDRERVYGNTPIESSEEYLLIDGYNIIYGWKEFANLVVDDMELARIKFLDIISNYAAMIKAKVIVVFDAYKVKREKEDIINYHNIKVIFTKEAQTADEYIERFSYLNKGKYKITVATSDGLEQIIIRGVGASVISANHLKEEIIRINKIIEEIK